MDIPWDDARLFLAVVEEGSLSRAAKRLGIAQPTVSRRLAELEARVGEPLFERTVAGATPTTFGADLAVHARRMADAAIELERALDKRGPLLEGRVRVTAPPGFAWSFLAPFAAWLREELPAIALEVVSTVRFLDLGRREADLALRFQKPDQKELVVLASQELWARPCVHPALAKRLGKRPAIHEVPWIGWAAPHDELLPNAILAKRIPGWVPAFASDDFLVQVAAAEAGLGAIVDADAAHRFARPTPLVPIEIEGVTPYRTALHLVAAKSSLGIAKVRAVAERLAAEISSPPATRARRGPRRARRARSR
ncbi:MAG: LysR family transcriptional regulator [Sandaracinaceae bacterium]|nr:LysR family transcriptional regulator [Sandaracinaceae bacterium]